MLGSVFAKWLWDARRSIIGWSVAVALVGGGYAAFWPTIDNPDLQAALESYPEALMEALNYTDVATAAGYLNASVYGLIVAVLVLIYAIAAGTRTIAGDEDSGTLDLILAHPVSRSSLALQRFAALLVSVIIIIAVLWLAMLALIGPAQIEGISFGQFAAMHLHLFLFAEFFGALAYSTGASTGRRTLAITLGASVAVLGFIANGVISQIDGWEWVRNLSPFQWLNGDNPLRTGVQATDALLMLGLAVVLVSVGTWVFTRRDVAV